MLLLLARLSWTDPAPEGLVEPPALTMSDCLLFTLIPSAIRTGQGTPLAYWRNHFLLADSDAQSRHKKICFFSSVLLGAKTKNKKWVSAKSNAGVPPQRVAMAAVAGATARRTTVLHNFV
jgi:hypothetical protein